MKKIIITLTAILALQTQVFSQLQNYSNNGKIKILAEKTSLSLTGVEASLIPELQSAGITAIAGAILAPTIDILTTVIQKRAEKNALAYIGEYKCAASGDRFYKNSNVAELPKLTIKRTVKTKDLKDEVAAEIELIPEISEDKTAFRYVVGKCDYKYSIAKTKGDYDYIDLNLEIKFKTIFIDKEEYKVKDLRTTIINIPMIKVGGSADLTNKIYSGWIPLPPRSVIKSTADESAIKETDQKNSEEYTDNTGLYEIEIIATETNPYKIKAENKKELIEGSNESITAILKTLGALITEEKK